MIILFPSFAAMMVNLMLNFWSKAEVMMKPQILHQKMKKDLLLLLLLLLLYQEEEELEEEEVSSSHRRREDIITPTADWKEDILLYRSPGERSLSLLYNRPGSFLFSCS